MKKSFPWCHNLSLGLTTKAKACKVASQEGSPGMKESVREWTLTLLKELPPWELESRWTLECSESECKGQNPMDPRVFHTIGNLLKLKCLKWARMTHLDIWFTSYGQKKGWESNWQFDSQPLKVKNRPDSLVCRWRETYHWKALDKGYNFVLDFISIKGLHPKLWGPKVMWVPTLAISGLPFGSPKTKCHLDVGLVERHIVYYEGENGGFPQVRAMVSLVNPSLPMVCHQKCSNYALSTLCLVCAGPCE